MVTRWVRPRTVVLALALAGTGLSAVPAAAQSDNQDARLRKIEAEVSALQRKVFPGGDGRFFAPEVITPQQGTPAPGAPSTTAVTDILSRMDSLEAQVARLTAQTEENTHAISEISARIDRIENPPPPPETVAAAPTATPAPTPTPAPAATPTPAPASKPAAPSSERLAAVQAIAKPQTDDPGDDEYTYGFRLWDAKFYPEAEQQLRLFVEKYPGHWRMSYGRNLLGRAYLDDGKPREAAPWFLQNYQSDKQGVRAPDSLLYLAESMIAIKDTNRACIALAEFSDTYPAIATGRLADQYREDRTKVKCN